MGGWLTDCCNLRESQLVPLVVAGQDAQEAGSSCLLAAGELADASVQPGVFLNKHVCLRVEITMKFNLVKSLVATAAFVAAGAANAAPLT